MTYWHTMIGVGMLMLFAIGHTWAQRRPRGYRAAGRPVMKDDLPKVPAGPALGATPTVHAADPDRHDYGYIETASGGLVAVVCFHCGQHWTVVEE